MANVPLKSIKFPDLSDTYTIPQIANNLDTSGKSADSKVTGDAIAAAEAKVGTLSNLTTTAKTDAVAAINEVDADVADLRSASKNVETFGFNYEFQNGYLSQGNVIPIGYRVASKNIMMYDRNLIVTIADGFRLGCHHYNYSTEAYTTNAGWQTGKYFIPAFTKFRIEIARVTENTSETADINEFLSKVTFESATYDAIKTTTDNKLIQSFAHKGYALTAPECTAAAMIEAKRHGYTGAECDIQITSDGKYVIWHDVSLSKLGDSNPISDYTLAELQAMDFGSWKSPKYAGEKILTFEEFVILCKKLGLQILIDTKVEFSEAQITELSNMVNSYHMIDNAIWYINFNGGYLAKLKELYPRARIAWIGAATETFCSIVAQHVIPGVENSVCAIPSISDLTAEDVARAHSYGISAGCYTAIDVNGDTDSTINIAAFQSTLIAAADKGIDLIVSDVLRAKDAIDGNLL